MVQYIAAHDNLPLHDVIAQSIKKDPSKAENELEIHKRIRIGNSIILTSQGTAFLHAGQEYGRTKQWKGEGVPEQKYHELKDEQGKSFGYFVHDSYDSSDAINMFDWEKATNKEEYEVNTTTQAFTKGLIELRKSTNAFRLGETELVDQNVTLLDIPEIQDTDLVIAYENVSTDKTGNYYVFVNADTNARTLTLGDYNFAGGEVLVDSDEAGVKPVAELSGVELTDATITIDPLTTVVIKLDRKATDIPSEEEPALSGWVQKDGKWFYYVEGVMATGWIKDGGTWYFLSDNGVMAKGWIKDGGTWYFLADSGVMKTGWIKDAGKWYFLADSGAMKTGWIKDAGKWYFLADSGAMKTGWIKDAGKWYFLADSGVMKTSWVKDGGSWYFLSDSGTMKTGWIQSGSKWYYLYSNGKMAYNTKIGKYYLGPDGAWIK